MNSPTPEFLFSVTLDEPGYASLAIALRDAYNQAAKGKGIERHNPNGDPFSEQPIMSITRMVGIGFPVGQAIKKTQEAATMARRNQNEQAIRELQGAIVYLAAAILHLEGE